MRITAEAKTATRQRILEVAEELFRTKGFEATTTRDIAQALGLSEATVRVHLHRAMNALRRRLEET